MIPPEPCVSAHSNSPAGSRLGRPAAKPHPNKTDSASGGYVVGIRTSPEGAQKKERLIQIRIPLGR